MVPIIMPVIGQDIPTGTIIRWLKHENDPVKQGEVVLEVESEKASFEVEADETGIILQILHQEGEEVDVLSPVGYIGSPDERPEHRSVPASPSDKKVFASPLARRTAGQLGIDLSGVKGTGPGGRIIKKNVLAAVESGAGKQTAAGTGGAGRAAGAPAPTDAIESTGVRPFSRTRQAIADRLTKSFQEKPHFYLFIDIEMDRALAYRASYNKKYDAEVTINDIIIHAAAQSLIDFPLLNGYVEHERLVVSDRINIGVAVSTDEGVLVPVIRDADKKPIGELSREVKKTVHSSITGGTLPAVRSTFTVSSLGMYGIKLFLPVINPPECAILGIGTVEQRVVPHQGMIGVKNCMTVSTACDHRAVDGVYAARFLQRLKQQLEKGFLWEE